MAAQCVPARTGAGAAVVDRPVVTDRLAEVAPMVRRMCIHRLGVWDGEDAAQEVLARLWKLTRQRPDYTGGPLFGWAVANVRYQVLNVYRQHQTHPQLGAMADISDRVLPDPAAGPQAHAERLESAREATCQVRELLAGLSLRERQVLLASGLGMRSHVETAARLGMTVANVEAARRRALARMREAVGVVPAGTLKARERQQTNRCRASAALRQPRHARPLTDRRATAAGVGLRREWMTAELIDRVTASLAAARQARKRYGRPRLAAEYGLTAHQAGLVLEHIAAQTTGPARRPAWMTAELLDRVTASITAAHQAGQPYGRPRLVAEHGLTHHRARLLLQHIATSTTRPAGAVTSVVIQ